MVFCFYKHRIRKMDRLYLKRRIASRKIVIFGAGKIAKAFVKKYQNALEICYFTSNDDKESELAHLLRLEPNKLTDMKNIYIIVCIGGLGMYDVESQLSMKFVWGEDYIPFDVFEEMVEGTKEMVLIIGQCQQQIIAHGLRSIDYIRNKYFISSFWYPQIRDNIAFRKGIIVLKEIAKYIIVLHNNIHQEILGIEEKTKLIQMPFLTMHAIYPQISWFHNMSMIYFENPDLMGKTRKKRYIGDIRAFRWIDNNIIKMIKAGMNESEILKEVSRDNYYSKEYLLEQLKKTENLNRNAEDGADLHLTNYINKMYRKEKLFLDGIHYSNFLAWRVVEKIISSMGEDAESIQFHEKDLILELSKENAVWENECPIYPSVWKNLGLEWVDQDTQYTMVKLYRTEQVSFEEYIIHHIRYTQHALEIERLW